MLIEELIRLGRPLIEGGLDAQELIEIITDVVNPTARNFYRHVFVVELPSTGNASPAVFPVQVWGDDLDGDFVVERERAVGAPILLPGGGNPLNPQGRYGVPVYPCWDRHFQDFRQSREGVVSFLRGRIERTPHFALSEESLQTVSEHLYQTLSSIPFSGQDRCLGVVILAQPQEDGPFHYHPEPPGNTPVLGQSLLRPGDWIVANLDRILGGLWEARVAEGEGQGQRPGVCSFTGEGEEVISAYSTVWPWAFLTWTCPVPHAGDTNLLVEGIGLCEASYKAFITGACVFRRLMHLVSPLVVHELFSPVDNREGRNICQGRSLNDLPRIYGSAFLLPIHDQYLGEDARADFADGIRMMLADRTDEGHLSERYLDMVTGFDVFLPEDLEREDYRLTLVYLSGEPSRGDIHLRACIQDVLPSTARRLRSLTQETAQRALVLQRVVIRGATEKQQAFLLNCYRSVPYLLSRAYGGSHLWMQLEQVLHRRPLDQRTITANAAARLASLVPRWPDSRFEIFDEVIFHLSMLDFWARYAQTLARSQGDHHMSMRPWPELLNLIEQGPIEEIVLCPSDPSELGFACGVLVRKFSRWYWMSEGKDYLEHRVLTFGSDLRPTALRLRGLAQMFDLCKRLPGLRMYGDFDRRVGVVLHELDNREREVREQRDRFMAAFWAGYALQGANCAETEETTETQTTGAQA